MLTSFHIQNYRLFKDLNIPKLSQVNLIAGKNNSGKTALLEALRIWASGNDDDLISVINNIIFQRGDFIHGSDKQTYTSLFFNLQTEETISFNEDYYILYERLVKEMSNSKRRFLFRTFGEHRIELNANSTFDIAYDKCIYIPFAIENISNTKLWEKISLTTREDDVVRILQIIEPRIIKVRIDNGKAKVLLKGDNQPIPLKNLGDGANRMLTIALGLVNAKDNLLLIDEFEIGLHYSVLDQLWDIIFHFAKEFNVQVVATTHSIDTIKSFYRICDKKELKDMGSFIRLGRSRIANEIVSDDYSMTDLELFLDSQLELR